MRMGWLSLAVVLGVAGCGGGGGGYQVATYPLIPNVAEAVPAGECVGLEQPQSLPVASTMGYSIQDTPVGIGIDSMEAGIMHLADFNAAGGCDFNSAIVDDTFSGSTSNSGPASAGTYQFIVGCANVIDTCYFNLNWTATY